MKLTPKQKKITYNIIQVIIGVASVYWGVYRSMKSDGRAKFWEQKYIVENSAREKADREVNRLGRVVNDVVVKVVTDNYDINDIPMPMGYKIYDPSDRSFAMVRTNKTYDEWYGTSTMRYFGKADSLVHKKYGYEYYPNDLKVMQGPEKKVWRFFENAERKDGGHVIGEFKKWKLLKDNNQYLYFLQTE